MISKFGLAAALVVAGATQAWAIDLTVLAPAQYSPTSPLAAGAEVHQKLVDQFEAQNPDIKVNFEVLDGSPVGLQKLLQQASTNDLPDVAVIDGQWIARLVQSNVLQPLNGLWPADDQADFHPAVLAAETVDGKPYAIMFQTGMRGLLYRPSQLAALGLSAYPKTYDDFNAMALKLKDQGVAAELVPGKSGEEPSTMHMLSVFWGLGGKLVDDTGKPVFFEGDNAKDLAQVYQMYHDMVAGGEMLPSISTMDETALKPFFYDGEAFSIGFSSSGVKQMWADQPDLRNDLAVAAYPMPAGDHPVTILGGYTYALTATDPDRKAAAWKYIQFMTSKENMGAINEALGQLPVRKSIWETNKFFSTDPLMVSYKKMYDGEMQVRPPVPIYNTISLALSAQIAPVISGQITPEQAVDAARDAVMPEYQRLQSR